MQTSYQNLSLCAGNFPTSCTSWCTPAWCDPRVSFWSSGVVDTQPRSSWCKLSTGSGENFAESEEPSLALSCASEPPRKFQSHCECRPRRLRLAKTRVRWHRRNVALIDRYLCPRNNQIVTRKMFSNPMATHDRSPSQFDCLRFSTQLLVLDFRNLIHVRPSLRERVMVLDVWNGSEFNFNCQKVIHTSHWFSCVRIPPGMASWSTCSRFQPPSLALSPRHLHFQWECERWWCRGV